jgi:hypothetical protein
MKTSRESVGTQSDGLRVPWLLGEKDKTSVQFAQGKVRLFLPRQYSIETTACQGFPVPNRPAFLVQFRCDVDAIKAHAKSPQNPQALNYGFFAVIQCIFWQLSPCESQIPGRRVVTGQASAISL